MHNRFQEICTAAVLSIGLIAGGNAFSQDQKNSNKTDAPAESPEPVKEEAKPAETPAPKEDAKPAEEKPDEAKEATPAGKEPEKSEEPKADEESRDKPKEKPKKKKLKLEEDDQDSPKTVNVIVPKRLRGQGYELLIENEPIDLSKDEIKIKPTLEQLSLDLYDKHGRVVDYRIEFLDQDVLENTHERAFRFAFHFGSSHSTQEGPWKKIFLTGNRFQLNGEFGYFFGPVGVTGHLTFQEEGSSANEGFVAYYRSVQVGTLIHYELVPFSFARNYWRKVFFSPLVGIFYASHSGIITDEEVEKSDSSSNFGLTFGGEMRFPVINNFYLMGRYFIQHQEIDLSGIGFKTTLPQHNFLFGGGYVF